MTEKEVSDVVFEQSGSSTTIKGIVMVNSNTAVMSTVKMERQ